MNRTPTRKERAIAGLLVVALTLFGCPQSSDPIELAPGLVEARRDALVPFRYGHVDAIGGNLYVRRVDLSIDTRLGTLEVGAVYNSATRAWQWSFDATYDRDSGVFVDETGARFELAALANGAAVPGSDWVKLGSTAVRTKHGLAYAFDADGRIAQVWWVDAIQPRLVFTHEEVAGAQRTTRVDQCISPTDCALVYAVTYDAAGRVAAIDDRAGRRAAFGWNPSGLVSARDALDVAERRPGFVYENAGGRLSSITNGEGERIEIDYVDGERVASIRSIGAGDPTDAFHYAGQVDGLFATRHWDALGNERHFHYDAHRRLRRITDVATGDVTSWTWRYGRPTSRTTPDRVTTRWTWSGDDLVTEVQPSGNVVRYTYAEGAADRSRPGHRPLARVEDDLGLVEVRTYDATGRIVSIENGAGEVTTVTYDLGFRTLTHPSGVDVHFMGYGEHGHPTFVGPVPYLSGQLRTYDAVGNVTQGAAPDGGPEDGGVVARAYDEDRNLRRLTLDDGTDVSIEVRSDGQPTAIRRPRGGDHEMDYDALGRMTARRERVDGVWWTTTFEYDALGRTTAIQRPNGMRQEFAYDAAGRPTSVTNLQGWLVEGTLSLAYEGGRLVAATDSIRGTTRELDYDGAGRVVRIRHGGGRETWRSYDVRSRKTAETFVLEGGLLLRSIGYGYDGADRSVEVRDAEDVLIERTYALGQLSQIRYHNGLTRTFAYDDELGLLAGAQTVDADDAIVESTQIDSALDAETGTATTRVETTTYGGVAATTVEEYALGPVAELEVAVGARIESFGDGGAPRALVWDGVSNLLEDGDATFVYNGEGNRLRVASGPGGDVAYAYDEAGFAIARGGDTIRWSTSGRMTSHGEDAFAWDVAGLPISATVDGVETTSLFDGRVVGAADGTPARLDLGDVAIDLATGARTYRHFDLRGNVKFTTTDAGTVRSHYAYGPHRVEAVHGADDDPVRFAGRTEVGELVLMGARVYDPAIGRFLSPDPILDLLDQYTYTHGNPLWFHDRDGLANVLQQGKAIFDLLGSIALAIGVLVSTSVGFPFLVVGVIFVVIGALLGLIDTYDLTPGTTPDRTPALPPCEKKGSSGAVFGSVGLRFPDLAPPAPPVPLACSPTSTSRSPHLPLALAVLLPLQVLLGALVVRRRRGARRDRAG